MGATGGAVSVGTTVMVTRGCAIAVAVGDVIVSVGTAVDVPVVVASGVPVNVGRVADAVADGGRPVAVAIGVDVGVAIGVDVGVAIGVDVGVAIGVGVGVARAVAIAVDVGVGVARAVAVAMTVGVVVKEARTTTRRCAAGGVAVSRTLGGPATGRPVWVRTMPSAAASKRTARTSGIRRR